MRYEFWYSCLLYTSNIMNVVYFIDVCGLLRVYILSVSTLQDMFANSQITWSNSQAIFWTHPYKLWCPQHWIWSFEESIRNSMIWTHLAPICQNQMLLHSLNNKNQYIFFCNCYVPFFTLQYIFNLRYAWDYACLPWELKKLKSNSNGLLPFDSIVAQFVYDWRA